MLRGIDYSAPVTSKHDYGTCSTTASTVTKTVACDGFALIPGAEITVKFTVTNTAANPSLNVNNSGAKPIYYRGAAISADVLTANHTYSFRYNGSQWDLVGDINVDTTYVNMGASTTSAPGISGLVPAPTAGSQDKYLTGAATWQSVDDHTADFISTDTDDTRATQWISVARLVCGETYKSIFNKLSTMFRNVRYLYKMLGTTDISTIGGGTITGAIGSINTELANKSNISHTHNNVTVAAKLARSGDVNYPMVFNWSGQGGQPEWLWGGNGDGLNAYVYNPSNFSVNYAATAGYAASAETANSAGSANSVEYGNVSGRPTFSISGTTLYINF